MFACAYITTNISNPEGAVTPGSEKLANLSQLLFKEKKCAMVPIILENGFVKLKEVLQ